MPSGSIHSAFPLVYTSRYVKNQALQYSLNNSDCSVLIEDLCLIYVGNMLRYFKQADRADVSAVDTKRMFIPGMCYWFPRTVMVREK